MKAIVFVRGDDWAGMYVDGHLALEGHSLPGWKVAEVLGFDVQSCPIDDDAIQAYLEEWGSFPDGLLDIEHGIWNAPVNAERM
jgi:hypothetical protein